MTTSRQHLDDLREIVAEVFELEPDEVSDTADFVAEYDADSLRAIEILARVEKRYQVEIPQAELASMTNLLAVHAVLGRYAGW
ncbi:acyl carrier protein [Actinosynnema sp. NPDC020468]|uniref:acyl carrier protein n=1 Tax=Actinosynnema sp. NPDC020468 TaxID=3154488 RepID=UPI0033E4FE4C